MPVPRRSRRRVECAVEREGMAAMALADQVRSALQHVHDPSYLERHPLAARLGATERVGGAGRALRTGLVDAVEALRPVGEVPAGDHGWRGYRILRRQYLDGLAPADVRAELAVSKSEYFRDQRRAIEAVGALLQGRWSGRPGAATAGAAPAPDAPGGITIPETRYARS